MRLLTALLLLSLIACTSRHGRLDPRLNDPQPEVAHRPEASQQHEITPQAKMLRSAIQGAARGFSQGAQNYNNALMQQRLNPPQPPVYPVHQPPQSVTVHPGITGSPLRSRTYHCSTVGSHTECY